MVWGPRAAQASSGERPGWKFTAQVSRTVGIPHAGDDSRNPCSVGRGAHSRGRSAQTRRPSELSRKSALNTVRFIAESVSASNA